MKLLTVGLVVVGLITLSAGAARAEETEAGHVAGVGYKIGNGIGFVGGDVIIRYIPHVSLDLQANYISESGGSDLNGTAVTVTGYGFAPTAQVQLKSIGHTPYASVGIVYVRESLGNVTASATGFLLNLGYEWRFASGVGVMVGGGFDRLGSIQASDGNGNTISQKGGFLPNIEAGVRYFF